MTTKVSKRLRSLADTHPGETPQPVAKASMPSGSVGFMICGIKKLADLKVGDTVTLDRKPAEQGTDAYLRGPGGPEDNQ